MTVYRNQAVIKEGDPFSQSSGTAKVYVVVEGELTYFKKVQNTTQSARSLASHNYHSLQLGTISEKEWLGEEVLEADCGEYRYTVLCTSSKASILMLDKNTLVRKIPDVTKIIMSQYVQKKKYREQVYSELARSKQESFKNDKLQAELQIKQKYIQSKLGSSTPTHKPGPSQQLSDNSKSPEWKAEPDLTNASHPSPEGNECGVYASNLSGDGNLEAGSGGNQVPSPTNRSAGKHLASDSQVKSGDAVGELPSDTEVSELTNITALMMDDKQKIQMKKDFANYIQTNIYHKYNTIQNLPKIVEQKVDPYPFNQKEAIIIRQLRENNMDFLLLDHQASSPESTSTQRINPKVSPPLLALAKNIQQNKQQFPSISQKKSYLRQDEGFFTFSNLEKNEIVHGKGKIHGIFNKIARIQQQHDNDVNLSKEYLYNLDKFGDSISPQNSLAGNDSVKFQL